MEMEMQMQDVINAQLQDLRKAVENGDEKTAMALLFLMVGDVLKSVHKSVELLDRINERVAVIESKM